MNRRTFFSSSLAALSLSQLSSSNLFALAEQPPHASSLEPWAPGVLEIHHIATNRGNSTLLLLPDGTTMMVDAGALYGDTPYLSPQRPSAEHRPGEWIGRYAQRRLRSAGLDGIDVFLLTHLHADHVGDL
ncbi:MAG TPA: MBL fold metallo-hydrolase, partial [Acidobacteriaceae bacterium]